MKCRINNAQLAYVKIENMLSNQNYFHSVTGIKYEAYIKGDYIFIKAVKEIMAKMKLSAKWILFLHLMR